MSYTLEFMPYGARTRVGATGSSLREAFDKLVNAAPVMSISQCGNPDCKSEDIRPAFKGGKYPGCMWRCNACGGNLTLHVRQEDGELYTTPDDEWWWPGKDNGGAGKSEQKPPI